MTDADPEGLPIVLGCPFRDGELSDAAALTVHSPDGEPLPTASRALLRWPGGSVRWVLLAFEARATGWHTVQRGAAPTPEHPVTVTEQPDGRFTLGNGLIQLALSPTGPGPITRIESGGHVVLDDAARLRFTVDDASSLAQPDGRRRVITVCERSPLRARLRVEGAHFRADGQHRLDYRLDVELWAGWPTARLDYQFLHLQPGQNELRLEEIRLTWRPLVGARPRRHTLQLHHGLFMRERSVLTESPLEIFMDGSRGYPHVPDVAMLGDDTVYPEYLECSAIDTGPWLGLVGQARSAYLWMHESSELRPKRLCSAGDELALDLWPRAAGAMTLPQGRSRRATITLSLQDSAPEPCQVSRLTQALVHEGRACVDPAWLRRGAVFNIERSLLPGAAVRFEKYLRRLTGDLHLAEGMFNLGDGIDDGYTRSYAQVGRLPPKGKKHDKIRGFRADPPPPDSLEPVWTNNEYDLIHALATELMRTGRAGLWEPLRRLTRHNIEVDFVHYSDDPWQHHGSPAHSANHNFSSSYPSHIWTQGLLAYHCLTGDADALDTAMKLGDTIIRNLTDEERGRLLWGFNREIGWPVLALVHLADLTGETRYRRQLDRLVDFLVAFDRRANTKPINLSGVNPLDDMHRQMVTSFFGYASMIEGVDQYVRLTGRDEVRRWLCELLEDLRKALLAVHRDGQPLSPTHMHLVAMAIGYEHTNDRAFLDAGMVCVREMIDGPLWTHPPRQVKPVAMTHRNLVRFLHHAQCAGLLKELDYP